MEKLCLGSSRGLRPRKLPRDSFYRLHPWLFNSLSHNQRFDMRADQIPTHSSPRTEFLTDPDSIAVYSISLFHGTGASIRIVREIQCLQYACFFFYYYLPNLTMLIITHTNTYLCLHKSQSEDKDKPSPKILIYI